MRERANEPRVERLREVKLRALEALTARPLRHAPHVLVHALELPRVLHRLRGRRLVALEPSDRRRRRRARRDDDGHRVQRRRARRAAGEREKSARDQHARARPRRVARARATREDGARDLRRRSRVCRGGGAASRTMSRAPASGGGQATRRRDGTRRRVHSRGADRTTPRGPNSCRGAWVHVRGEGVRIAPSATCSRERRRAPSSRGPRRPTRQPRSSQRRPRRTCSRTHVTHSADFASCGWRWAWHEIIRIADVMCEPYHYYTVEFVSASE